MKFFGFWFWGGFFPFFVLSISFTTAHKHPKEKKMLSCKKKKRDTPIGFALGKTPQLLC
jgi:hypothetical protein